MLRACAPAVVAVTAALVATTWARDAGAQQQQQQQQQGRDATTTATTTTATTTATTAAVREQARVHFERGVALADDGRWPDAIRELSAARALAPTAPVLYNLGVAYRAVGRNRAAIASLEEFLRVAGPALPPERAREVARMIAELRAGLARVVLTVAPARAALLVDGAPVAPASAARGYEVDPGRHVITAQAEGFRAATRALAVAPGALARLELRLDPAAHDTSAATRGGVVRSPWLWTGVAVVVVGALVVGGVVLFSGPSAPFVGPYGHVTDALEVRR